jgi:hypothetical protein
MIRQGVRRAIKKARTEITHVLEPYHGEILECRCESS